MSIQTDTSMRLTRTRTDKPLRAKSAAAAGLPVNSHTATCGAPGVSRLNPSILSHEGSLPAWPDVAFANSDASVIHLKLSAELRSFRRNASAFASDNPSAR
jgi:hypothetical protein